MHGGAKKLQKMAIDVLNENFDQRTHTNPVPRNCMGSVLEFAKLKFKS